MVEGRSDTRSEYRAGQPVRFSSGAPRRWLFLALGVLFSIPFVGIIVDEGASAGIFVAWGIMLAILALPLLVSLRPRWVEVAGDRLTLHHGSKAHSIDLSKVVAVGFGSLYFGGEPGVQRGLFLDLLQNETSYGYGPVGAIWTWPLAKFFPREKHLGSSGAGVKHFMLNVTGLDKPSLFRLILPRLLADPAVYIPPKAREALESYLTTG